MKLVLTIIGIGLAFVGYEFVASLYNKGADQTAEKENQQLHKEILSGSVKVGDIVATDSNIFNDFGYLKSVFRFPKFTRLFSEKPS